MWGDIQDIFLFGCPKTIDITGFFKKFCIATRTTDTDGNLTQSAADQSWNVKYDPATVTLTLRGATIQGGTNTGPAPFGSGIYALCSEGQSVALTIELIGTNTITGNYGIYVDA